MNINTTEATRPCTSCQMCAAVCPKDAIGIALDAEGFYRPAVDESRCVDCGLCTRVCYRLDDGIQMTSAEQLAAMPLYAAAAKDERLLPEVTSGGVADLLARQLVAEGYTCIGVGYDDERARAYSYLAKTQEKTLGFRGSKYIQSYTLDAFKELVQRCRTEKFAVFGTPCHVYAVHRFLELRKLRGRCILIDLFCHGTPSLLAWRKYQHEVKQEIRKPRFDRVDFRSKVKGWGSFYVVVVVVDGLRAFVSSPRKDEFYELFFSDQVLNEACATCKLRSTMAYPDIRLGDFWGHRFALDEKGVSAVAVATERGKRLYEAILPKLSSQQADYADMLPYQSYGRDYRPNTALRTELLRQLGMPELSLRQTIKTLRKHQSMKTSAKRHVKHILYYLPVKVTKFLKRWL